MVTSEPDRPPGAARRRDVEEGDRRPRRRVELGGGQRAEQSGVGSVGAAGEHAGPR